jgi:hypothetical protein
MAASIVVYVDIDVSLLFGCRCRRPRGESNADAHGHTLSPMVSAGVTANNTGGVPGRRSTRWLSSKGGAARHPDGTTTRTGISHLAATGLLSCIPRHDHLTGRNGAQATSIGTSLIVLARHTPMARPHLCGRCFSTHSYRPQDSRREFFDSIVLTHSRTGSAGEAIQRPRH